MIKSIVGMFVGADGCLSSTKLFAISGYALFLFISLWMAIYSPEKFSYEIFAILSATSSASMRVIDKWLNVRSAAQAASAIVATNALEGNGE